MKILCHTSKLWYFVKMTKSLVPSVHFFHKLPPSPSSLTHFYPVLRIRDILVRIRMRILILGSVPLTNGSGSGSVTLVHLHHSSKIKKVIKKSQNSRNQDFSYYFCLMWKEDQKAGSGAESVLVTNGSGSATLLISIKSFFNTQIIWVLRIHIHWNRMRIRI